MHNCGIDIGTKKTTKATSEGNFQLLCDQLSKRHILSVMELVSPTRKFGNDVGYPRKASLGFRKRVTYLCDSFDSILHLYTFLCHLKRSTSEHVQFTFTVPYFYSFLERKILEDLFKLCEIDADVVVDVTAIASYFAVKYAQSRSSDYFLVFDFGHFKTTAGLYRKMQKKGEIHLEAVYIDGIKKGARDFDLKLIEYILKKAQIPDNLYNREIISLSIDKIKAGLNGINVYQTSIEIIEDSYRFTITKEEYYELIVGDLKEIELFITEFQSKLTFLPEEIFNSLVSVVTGGNHFSCFIGDIIKSTKINATYIVNPFETASLGASLVGCSRKLHLATKIEIMDMMKSNLKINIKTSKDEFTIDAFDKEDNTTAKVEETNNSESGTEEQKIDTIYDSGIKGIINEDKFDTDQNHGAKDQSSGANEQNHGGAKNQSVGANKQSSCANEQSSGANEQNHGAKNQHSDANKQNHGAKNQSSGANEQKHSAKDQFSNAKDQNHGDSRANGQNHSKTEFSEGSSEKDRKKKDSDTGTGNIESSIKSIPFEFVKDYVSIPSPIRKIDFEEEKLTIEFYEGDNIILSLKPKNKGKFSLQYNINSKGYLNILNKDVDVTYQTDYTEIVKNESEANEREKDFEEAGKVRSELESFLYNLSSSELDFKEEEKKKINDLIQDFTMNNTGITTLEDELKSKEKVLKELNFFDSKMKEILNQKKEQFNSLLKKGENVIEEFKERKDLFTISSLNFILNKIKNEKENLNFENFDFKKITEINLTPLKNELENAINLVYKQIEKIEKNEIQKEKDEKLKEKIKKEKEKEEL